MRYLYLGIILFLVSCSQKSEDLKWGYFADAQFSIDTVMIDPGDEIIFIQQDLFGSDLSPNGKFLYNFNWNDHTLEKINLDDLRLEEKFPV
jgi:hypothetical protein